LFAFLRGDKVGATFHDLGDLGRLVTINVPTADALREGGIEVSKKKPLVVAIVDRSGSMGSWVTHTINSTRVSYFFFLCVSHSCIFL